LFRVAAAAYFRADPLVGAAPAVVLASRVTLPKHAEREDLKKSVSQKLAQFVDLEGRLAAQQAAIARLERFHRYGDVALALEAMIVRVARGDGGDAAPDAKRRRREK